MKVTNTGNVLLRFIEDICFALGRDKTASQSILEDGRESDITIQVSTTQWKLRYQIKAD